MCVWQIRNHTVFNQHENAFTTNPEDYIKNQIRNWNNSKRRNVGGYYEIIKDGKHVNPLTVKLPAIDNLDAANKKKFLEYRETLDKAIENLIDNPKLFIQIQNINL